MELSTRLTARYFRYGVCAEAGAALLFFGALAQQPDLQQAGAQALVELAAQGYQTPKAEDPLRIFPALTDGQFSAQHAGGWRPGRIYLRSQPQGGLRAAVYLRHEIFHEASERSCGGRRPLWAEEAAAMHFSGELSAVTPGPWPEAAELAGLKTHIQQGAALDSQDRNLLGRLVNLAGWPQTACAQSEKLQALLGTAFSGGDSAYLLMSLVSGRLLTSGGDQHSRMPPGSLLKIPYAAALSRANPSVLAAELAASDTEKLLARRPDLQIPTYRTLLSTFPPAAQGIPENPQSLQDWRAYLGEREGDSGFDFQAGLPELALTLRAALLRQPSYFQGLSLNGVTPNSTLAGQSVADRQLLQQLQALAKTGSVSNANGQALVGHLMLAWPAEHPVYLAVFRQLGVRGAAILHQAAGLLQHWRQTYPLNYATVRVRLLTLTPRDSWEAQADCPELTGPHSRFSLCGQFRLVSSAPGSRSERLVSGIIHAESNTGPALLETDMDSYVDAVLSAEAQTLTGSAKTALRAVITWNAAHGGHRHPDTQALCDTTHCMVFLGAAPKAAAPSGSSRDPELLPLLEQLAQQSGLDWLAFSLGGTESWQRQFSGEQLRTHFHENRILDLRRERRKQGGPFVHLYYADSEETLSCETFRNSLKLPSCPDAIHYLAAADTWNFQGIGAGHGLGLSLSQAQALAEHGRSAAEILLDAYGAKH